ncbi:MAG: response regulator [Gammaproteobacteria bacterium]
MSKGTTPEHVKPRLLLVDDSRVMRASAGRILGGEFDVVLAKDGEEAWACLENDGEIQAVFTDLGMPRLDGYGLLERIRQSDIDRISHLPVIIVTGQEGDEARADALRRGATDFITKPFNQIDLTARAQAHATNTRQQRTLEENTTLDSLTKLGNQRYFLDKIAQDRSFTLRHSQDFSIVYLDVCNIRTIAATAGKEQAALVIKQVASVIRTTIRQEDTAARVNTGRFAISLPACDARGVRQLARRLQNVLNAANERHSARSMALQVVIAATTPSDEPDAEMDTVLAELEASLVPAGSEGIEIAAVGAAAPAGHTRKAARTGGKGPSLDQALAMIEAGEQAKVRPYLGKLVNQLLPLLRLLSESQRDKLAMYLKCDES